MKIWLDNILSKKTRKAIQYRWIVDGVYTEWTNYKFFKTKMKRDEVFEKLVRTNTDDFIEYRVN